MRFAVIDHGTCSGIALADPASGLIRHEQVASVVYSDSRMVESGD